MTTVAAFCISSKGYSDKASSALESLKKYCDQKIDIYNISTKDIYEKKYNNKYIEKTYEKYANNEDILRWSLKPCLLLYFLQNLNYEKCIYIDNDVYFVNNNTFLIDQIDKGILLTKHNRPLFPNKNPWIQSQFMCNFTDGFFNAGFIGANKNGEHALEWWHTMTLWRCSQDKCQGLYDDQKYLDILALQFNKETRICDHPGCNLATWNTHTCKRSLINDAWKIEDIYDPIFLHFSSMGDFSESSDPMLFYYYKKYIK